MRPDSKTPSRVDLSTRHEGTERRAAEDFADCMPQPSGDASPDGYEDETGDRGSVHVFSASAINATNKRLDAR